MEMNAATRAFCERARELGLADPSRFFWYHTIDLGDGLVTPGQYDYRETLPLFHFPADLSGMDVLDVGSATGFFAFELERRGGRVVSLELPSLSCLDRFPGQSVAGSLRKIERMMFSDDLQHSEAELYHCLLEGPFEFCRARLGARPHRCYSTIYDVNAEKCGVPEGFDLVFIGDVLLHTLEPLRALSAVAAVCRGTLVLAQALPSGPQEPPAMVYVGGADPQEDDVSWWLPNRSCLMQLLSKLGFAEVEQVGVHRGLLQPVDHPFERAVFHARRIPGPGSQQQG